MTDNDVKLQKTVVRAFASDDEAPGFDETWHAAESRYRRGRRYRGLTGVAASAAVIAIVVVNVMQPGPQDVPIIEMGELLGTTSWQAPSDVLLPEHRIDIYQELPELIQSTDGTGEALL
jgi:hypothetical protein